MRKQVGTSSRYVSKVLCLDKRTGAELCNREVTRSTNSAYEIHADPDNRRIEVRTYLGTLKLKFTDKPKDEKKTASEDEEEATPQHQTEAAQPAEPGEEARRAGGESPSSRRRKPVEPEEKDSADDEAE